MAVTDPAPTIWAKLQQVAKSIRAHVQDFLDEAKAAIGWAAEETPKLEETLTTVTAALTCFFPQAGVLESFLLDVENAVKFAEPLVKTAEGVVMQLDQANAENATVVGRASSAEKHAVAVQMIADANPGTPANIINLAIEPKVAQVNSSAAIAAPAPAKS